jgi:DNA helicase-2/ATP-dependent DNA helicase PcrA
MAEKLSEIDEIFVHISKNENFLLSGGAGSGKTYSLVQVVKRIYDLNPIAKVACITYTNIAVKQIKERVQYQNLRISTIHDFLWDNIKFYQKNLKESILALIKTEKISDSSGEIIDERYFDDKSIDYKEWTKIIDGIISHDEVILLAEHLFANYPLLTDILKDKFDYILIDEYQDTSVEVINILLEYLPKSDKKNILGFFGDSMQSIYDDTIGDIKKYVDSGIVKEVIKQDNRRNPKLVIDLANKLRTDSVKQKPAEDLNAPNYGKEGYIKFLYSTSYDIDAIKRTDYFKDWDFSNSDETKELYLTHNLIAPKAGFPELMKIYDKDRILEYKYIIVNHIKANNLTVSDAATFGDIIAQLNVAIPPIIQQFLNENPELYEEAKKYPFEIFRKLYLDKDQLIGSKKGTEEEERRRGSKRDDLVKHLFHIQECINFYEKGKYNEFIRKTGFRVTSIQSKIDLKDAIETLKGMKESPIEDVINFADDNNIWIKNDKLSTFIEEKEYVYNRVKKVKFKEFCNLFEYIEGYTPYSTQHNIKGAEFDNVFVVLDNGKWNKFNFKNLFLGGGTDSVLKRTQKIFYVCSTRAKQNLIVFYNSPETKVIQKAKEWFGSENVISI